VRFTSKFIKKNMEINLIFFIIKISII